MNLLEFLFGKRRPRISLRDINHKLDIIMSNQADLAVKVKAITTQLNKISQESTRTLQEVERLKAVLAEQENVTPELQAAVDALAEQVQAVDDLTPDVVEPTPETPPTE